MTIEATGRKLYYADNVNKLIASIDLNGTNYRKIVSTGPLSQPKAVVIVVSLG